MEHANKIPVEQSGVMARGASGLAYLRYVLSRFAADQCTQRAGALTYTTLLALVPLLAISFTVFAAFPVYEGMRGQLQTFIFENFVPQVGPVVLEHLEQFVAKTGRLTAIGIAFLFVTSVMLLSTISSTCNAIWRVRQTRNLLVRLPVYWFILTAGTVLLGASMYISGYLFTMARATGVEEYTGPLTRLAGVVPVLLQILALTLLYIFTPNFPVRWRDALVGGITAGLLLELLKKGFAWYVTSFPTYQTIYGAMATIPIFLIWMYVLWNVVLYGAEMAAALPEWRAGVRRVESGGRSPAAVLSAAAAILALLLAAHRRGGGLRRQRLMRRTGQPPELLSAASDVLRQKNYIDRTDKGMWILARDLEAVTLADLHRDLGLSVSAVAARAEREIWGKRLAETLTAAEEAGRKMMDMPLKSLLELPEESGQQLAGPVETQDDEAGDENSAGGDYKTRLLAWLGLAWLIGR